MSRIAALSIAASVSLITLAKASHAQVPAPDPNAGAIAPLPALPVGGNAQPPPPDAPASSPAAAATAPTPGSTPAPVTNKWGASLYGFAELDMINDSTQSFNDLAGNAAIARPGTYAGELGRATMGVRNSRLGFKIAGPLQDEMRVSGQIEVDFFGAQAATPEAAFWTNSLVRMRHAFLKFENPYVDVLAGQYWQLFGWQTFFHPNTVEIQGLAGEVFSRG